MPPLAPVASSEDDCLTSSDELDTPCPHRKLKFFKQNTIEEFAIDFSMPRETNVLFDFGFFGVNFRFFFAALFSNLSHLTKNRAQRPKLQRKPTKYVKVSHETSQNLVRFDLKM